MIHVYPNPADAAIAELDTSNLDVAVSTRASQSSVDTIDANVDTTVGLRVLVGERGRAGEGEGGTCARRLS